MKIDIEESVESVQEYMFRPPEPIFVAIAHVSVPPDELTLIEQWAQRTHQSKSTLFAYEPFKGSKDVSRQYQREMAYANVRLETFLRKARNDGSFKFELYCESPAQREAELAKLRDTLKGVKDSALMFGDGTDRRTEEI